jgi:DNA-binding transcriptional LysR family regulator
MKTVSGAADVLGVHHATVIRHIDALEGRLGVKLFQRHARGYTPTEAGEDLFRVAQATDDQFSQLVGRMKGQIQEVTGELVVTSLSYLAPQLVPVLTEFQNLHPGLVVRFLTGERLFRLEYGEAHVAIRAGSAPEQPDNVVLPFAPQPISLFASRDYVERFGMPKDEKDLSSHRFVSYDDAQSRAPFARWLNDHVSRDNVVFRATNERAIFHAICSGAGMGFAQVFEARAHPDLVEIIGPRDEWQVPQWLVTHVDLHRTTKVQTFLSFLREKAKAW